MPDLDVIVVAWDAVSAEAAAKAIPTGDRTRVLLITTSPDEAADDARSLPADAVTIVTIGQRDPEAAAVAYGLIDILREADVIVLDSSQQSRDLAGWLVGTLNSPLVWAVDAFHHDVRQNAERVGRLEAERIFLAGNHRLIHQVDAHDAPIVLLLKAPVAGRPEAVTEPAIDRIDLDLSGQRVTTESANTSPKRGRALSGARMVLSVGRGIGGPGNVPLFSQLADQLGAAFGASRVAVDLGWVPFAHQVGQTGTSVSPDVYLAFGISGAVQHLAGMRGSHRVVAVNTDATAPLCRLADIVIEGDAVDIARELLDRLPAL